MYSFKMGRNVYKNVRVVRLLLVNVWFCTVFVWKLYGCVRVLFEKNARFVRFFSKCTFFLKMFWPLWNYHVQLHVQLHIQYMYIVHCSTTCTTTITSTFKDTCTIIFACTDTCTTMIKSSRTITCKTTFTF